MPTDISITNLDESVSIKWTDPEDITLNGAPLAEWDGTIVVRKAGSAPKSKVDGTIIIDSKVKNQYKDIGFIDTGLTNGVEYFYGIFPYTLDGVYNYRYNQSIITEPIYPDPPTNIKIVPRDSKVKISFTLPSNAVSARICYSSTEPESNTEVYGTTISDIVENPYIVSNLINDTTYYITVYSSNGKRYTPSDIITVTPRLAEIYSFTIDDNEPDPDSRVTYGEDNTDFNPAYMDYENDTFNYGDWADAFFMNVKPCMLKYDGTVDYYLDKNNVEYKEDGATQSDVANENYEGNAMVEFPRIYYKCIDRGNKKGTYIFSDVELDDEFECYSFVDSKNNIIEHCYMPMYDGSLINGKLRSLSGKNPITKKTKQQDINSAKANNLTDDIIWYINVLCDRFLIQLLLILISKSTDTQTKFGTGNVNTYVNTETNTGIKITGTLNDKGLFYGKQDQSTCVKVFGIENFWGNVQKNIAGYINDHGTQKIKMTYGTYDGSTVEGYNGDGTGYITISDAILSGNNGYISEVKFTKYGLIPYILSGTAFTYYCDYYDYNKGKNCYMVCGGISANGVRNGAFLFSGTYTYSESNWSHNSSLSCKPLSTNNDL